MTLGPDAVLVIALAALGLGLINGYQLLRARREEEVVEVEVGWALPTDSGWDGSGRVGAGYVTVTATNMGSRPARVHAMWFETWSGRIILLEETPPGHALPAMLRPGDDRSMWIKFSDLEDSLRTDGSTLKSAIVSGPSGKRWITTRLWEVGKVNAMPEW